MPLSLMTGVFIDLRRAIRERNRRAAAALVENYPALATWPDLQPAEKTVLKGWGVIRDERKA